MARVEVGAQEFGTIIRNGQPVPNATVQIATLAGPAATHWSAVTGGTSSTANLSTDVDGVVGLAGAPRFVDEGTYTLTSGGTTRRVEAVSGATLVSAESGIAARLTENTEDYYGTWYTRGNAPGSIGFAGTPTAAPATTVGSGGVTLPLTNGTVPITDTAQLSANGGSFTLGGHVIVYSGRSTSSGAGNATGAYTLSTASGTYASGTALGFTSIGYGPLAIYEKFGDSTGGSNRPIPGTTQAGYLLANYYGPTVDDSMEGFSAFVGAKDTGTPYAQHKPITGFEGIAQIEGGNTAMDGYTAPLLGTASRTNVVGASTHVKNVIGHKLSHNSTGGPTFGAWDAYDGLYQAASALSEYGTLNGAATLPQATIPVTGTFPAATATNPVTVLIGPNADGVGGQPVTYTGQSGGSLTGATGGTGTIATGSRITNIVRGVNVQDPLGSAAGVLLGDTGWSASLIAALRGGTDGDLAMLALTGPTNAEVSGGLTLVRLNAGSGQTKSVLKMYDTGGSNRMSLSVAGDWIASGRKFIGQQAGTTTCVLDGSNGSMQLGISTAAGGKLYSGSGAPGTISGQADGDIYFRTDGGAGTTIYQRRAGAWVATAA